MESKRSVTRSYPTGRRGREVSRNKHDGGIGEGLEETAPGCSRRLPIDTKTAIELWLRALQSRMHDVATQDHGGALALHHNAHVTGRVSCPRLNPDVVVEGIIRSDQLGLTTFHDRQQAVFIVGIGGIFGSQFSYPPVLPSWRAKRYRAFGKVGAHRPSEPRNLAEPSGTPDRVVDRGRPQLPREVEKINGVSRRLLAVAAANRDHLALAAFQRQQKSAAAAFRCLRHREYGFPIGWGGVGNREHRRGVVDIHTDHPAGDRGQGSYGSGL